ncbi:HAD family hydrolase [Sphingoaurantiacus capsulatus]|uniref:HAD family hydrolase n=1 Tax=Sphingoaurantiacus capsulatus TaxID=1771310 RepID=A0ABV7XAU0_9SPHN
MSDALAVHAAAAPTSIVFDVGGVLYDWHPRYLYEKLIDDPARLEDFLSRVVTHEWHFQHDEGRPVAETSAELIARFPEHRELIEAYNPRWLETIPGPIPGMIDLVDEIAAAGIPLYAITNFSHEFWPRFIATAPVFRHFREIVVSGDERMVKPDPRIFALAKARFGVSDGEALFIDDRADNVAASEAAGFVGHVFDGASNLRARLRELRLLG